jgi:glycosyltransferase involved in cell wall biosynthesis
MPKISVIIPVYNVEKYLRECLDSVIHQTLKDLEIICVNDGSTDGSLAILEEYAKKDSRIIIIKQKNQGQGAARNRALKIAKGEYVQFLDSDDYLSKDACEILYHHANEKSLDMLLFGGYNFNDGENILLNNPYWDKTYLDKNIDYSVFQVSKIKNVVHRLPVSACLCLYKRHFIAQKEIKFPQGLFYEDTFFFIKAITQACNIGINFSKLYQRRLHPEQVTQNWNKLFSDYLKIINLILSYLQSIKINEEIYLRYRNSYLGGCRNRYNGFDEDEQKKYAKQLSRVFKKYHYEMHTETEFWKKVKYKNGNKSTRYLGGIIKKVKNQKSKKFYLFGVQIFHKRKK